MSKDRFKLIRVRMTGMNDNKHYYLALSGLELYGELYAPPEYPMGGVGVGVGGGVAVGGVEAKGQADVVVQAANNKLIRWSPDAGLCNLMVQGATVTNTGMYMCRCV